MVRTSHSSSFLPFFAGLKTTALLFSLLFMGSAPLLVAQPNSPTESFDLAYDFDYIKENTTRTGEGTLILNVTFRPEGTNGIFLADKTGIRVTGLRQKKAEFIFRVKEVRVKGISDRKLNFQLPDACHRISGPVRAPVGHTKFLPLEELTKGKELFRMEAKGTGNFVIDIGFLVYHRDATVENSVCNNRILLTGKIEDVPEPLPTPPTYTPPPDSLALEIAKKKGVPGVQEWITNNSTSDFLSAAMDWLTTEKNRLLKSCLACADTSCLEPCYTFLNHFRGDSKEEEVRAHIKKVTPVPPPNRPTVDPEKEAFLQCLELEDKAASLECLKQLLDDNPDHALKEQILEHVDRLEPIKYQREKSGNTYIYQLSHVKNPRWKDISQDYGMVVDDSKLLSDKQLRIRLTESGKYKLYLEDEWGKEDTIELANILNAVLDKIGTGYQLFVEGGNPPYQVQLVNLSSNEADKTFEDIQDSLVITDEDIAALGGREYLVWVHDGGGLSKTKAGEFTTPIKENNWPAFLTLIAIVLILLLMVAYLIWYFRKRRAQQLVLQQSN